MADTNLMVHKHVGMPAHGILVDHRKWELVPQTASPEISEYEIWLPAADACVCNAACVLYL